MDMSQMGGMGGMDMSTDVMFAAGNSALARAYWYIVAGVVGFTIMVRVLNYLQARVRLRLARSRAISYPTQPRTWYWQAFATSTATYRELVGPQRHFRARGVRWLSPPPMGRTLLVLIYFAVIAYMLTSDAIIHDAYYWERVAFRAAWISATQVPMVYLLASKSSILGFLVGTSYDRLNFLHRWISRTLLITTTIHGAFFFREWWLADFIDLELKIMPMVKYGLGAWFLLVWTTLSSLTPIRRLSHEVFVVQHLAAAGALLWLLYIHIPAYAQYNVWFAIAAVAFDKLTLWGWTMWCNLSVRRSQKFGHQAELRAVSDDITEVVVHDVGFKWTPGQHVYLRIPSLGPFEAHPFTAANVSESNSRNSMQLLIKAKKGFTRRLAKNAQKAGTGRFQTATALVTGPFGKLPNWSTFETLVLVSASTGASFTLPILDNIIHHQNVTCVSRIHMLLIVRNREQIQHHLARLSDALSAAQRRDITLAITIAITCPCDAATLIERSSHNNCDAATGDELAICKCGNKVPASLFTLTTTPLIQKPTCCTSEKPTEPHDRVTSVASSIDTIEQEKSTTYSNTLEIQTNPRPSSFSGKSQQVQITSVSADTSPPPSEFLHPTTSTQMRDAGITYSIGTRPDIALFVREAVEVTGGETSVVVCGGAGLVAETRNVACALSDERAVHKGTGAQGIHVHSETYCF